jgi:hypothetical protein
MSEFVDTTLGRYLDQQPGMREALLKDPVQHMQAEVLRQTLNMVERALIDEGVPEETRRRVLNRAIWGEPEGRVDVHARMRDPEKLRRERDLLLTTFDPSEFGFPSDSGSFAALAKHVNRADESAGPVRPDEEPTP